MTFFQLDPSAHAPWTGTIVAIANAVPASGTSHPSKWNSVTYPLTHTNQRDTADVYPTDPHHRQEPSQPHQAAVAASRTPPATQPARYCRAPPGFTAAG